MASIKPSTRYSSSNSSSASSSSSSSHKNNPPSFNSSRALVQTKTTPQSGHNLGSLLRKLVDKRSGNGSKKGPTMVDPIAKEINKAVAKKAKGGVGGNFSALSRKLFQKGDNKALTEVKSNTRTLAMVLRSERELLMQNKEYQEEISQLNLLLEQKNNEVEKLKDLCLKQREEIKALKDAVLFPDDNQTNLKKELAMEKQSSELQTQVSSLTAQLNSLARDLAQVKAEKLNNSRACVINDAKEETTFPSVDYGSSEYGSPEGEMFFKDFNPCLTPRFSKQLVRMDYDGCESPSEGMLSDLCGEMNAMKICQLVSPNNLFSSP